MSVIWKISILVLCVTVEGGKSALCPRVKSKFCSEIGGLGYEKTFFPNIMDHADQKEAKEAMKPYEELAKTGCSPYIRAFVCASFLPACPVWRDVPKKPQKPCRELCERARKDCEATLLNDLEMEWPAELNCEDFPSHDPSRRNPVCTNFVPPRPAFCQKHKEVGPCRTYRPYWYYDVSEHKCMTFTFGGCLGNENKFETKEQCLHVCGNVAPTIATMTTPQFVSEGDKLVVECKGDGVPPPTILWERKNGGRVKSKGQGTKRLLIIKNAQASDAGIYYCIAVNQAGHANYTVEVEIDSSVEILEEIQPQIIMENETAFFVCMATGNPEPQFSWRRLDGAFPDESRVVIEGPIVNDTLDYPIYTSILGIEPAMGSDTGSYQCYAYNSVGNYTAVGDLIVQGPPGFLQEPEAEQIVSIGDFAYFTCVGSGAPPFNITWSKEGDAEWPSEDSRVVIEDNNTFLRISDVTPDDSGMYVCTISNEMGMKSAVSNLLVEDNFSDTLAILTGPLDTRALVGETVRLKCRVTGNPFPTVKWVFNGIAIDPLGLFDERVEQEGTNLIIRKVNPRDTGHYHCLASSKHGKAMASATLTVYDGGSTMSSSSSGAGTDEGEATSMTAGPTEEMKSSVSPSDEEGSMTDEMKSSPSVESGKTDGSTMTGGPSGTQPTSGLDASTEEMQGSAEPSGSPDPMGSPDPSASPEPMASPEPSGSPEPMASPEPSASPEPMGSPEPSASPEPMASADASSDSMASMGSTATSDPSAPSHGMMDESTMVHKTDMMASGTTKSMVSSSAGHSEDSSMMPTSQSAQVTTPVKPRRTDITNPGTRDLFQGWVDVQGQGAANDFCRIIGTSSDVYQLVCSLAGTEGEEEFNYNSKIGFDIGEKDTFYMKDENGDGRDDYCRCTSVTGKRYVWCTAGGENGFYGNEKVEPDTSQHSFQAEGEKNDLRKCRRRFVDPFFGIPY